MGKKLIIVSVIVLALLTPVMVKFITENKTSSVNYASGESTATIMLNPTDGPLELGSNVSFATTYASTIQEPRVEVLCYQDDVFTFGTAGATDQEFKLGGESSRWLNEFPNDPAECTANLYHYKTQDGKEVYTLLATTEFAVAGR